MAKYTWLDLSEAKKAQAVQGTFSLQSSPDEMADIFTGLKTASGQLVNREKAIRVSAVLACVRILMEDISSPSLILKRKIPTGAIDAVDHPAYRLLKTAPNDLQTSVEVREHNMMDLLLTGKFACWQQRDASGTLKAIYPLRATALSFLGSKPMDDGSLLLNWNYSAPELSRTFTQFELWRGSIMSQSVIDGHSLILLAREAIGLAIAAEEQGARLFSNGIQTDVVIRSAGEMDQDGRDQLQRALQSTYGGSANSWKALLLEQGLEVEKIGLTAQESQYIEARNYQMQDIARVFRIPGVMLGIGDKTSTYASAEQFFLAYTKFTLQPWFVRLEQTISRDLILPSERDLFAKHDLSSLLRSDQKTRFQTYAIGITAGFMARNEARVAEDWDTLDGLDEMLIPANSIEVDDENEAAEPGAPNNQPKKGQRRLQKHNEVMLKLAENIATAIIRSEVKWFARNINRPETAANFHAWHIERVQQLTGASFRAVQEYSAWRMDTTRDPLLASSEVEARKQIIKLCGGIL